MKYEHHTYILAVTIQISKAKWYKTVPGGPSTVVTTELTLRCLEERQDEKKWKVILLTKMRKNAVYTCLQRPDVS